MSSTPKFAHVDTRKPDGFYVQFARKVIPDDSADRPDEMDDGFWPSLDPKAAGYVSPDKKFEEEHAKAKQRMADYEHGVWGYVGVRAQARCLIVKDGTGTLINLESPGVWGIESDSGDYLDEVYADEVLILKDIIEAMQHPTYEEAA